MPDPIINCKRNDTHPGTPRVFFNPIPLFSFLFNERSESFVISDNF